MSKRTKMAALVLAANWVSLSASAQDETIITDVRCVVVGMKLSSGISTEQSEGIILSWYFIGRLDGREPKLDIKRLLSEALARMNSAAVSLEERRWMSEDRN